MEKVALFDIEVRLECIEARQERIEGKLDRICAYIDKVDSEAYRNNEDAKQMVMNIIADVFADGRLKPNNFNR